MKEEKEAFKASFRIYKVEDDYFYASIRNNKIKDIIRAPTYKQARLAAIQYLKDHQ